MGDELFVKLRDCFTAGYTLPQYCIDNGIKKPLFVSEKKYELFLWEVYVQFHYDKRMMAQFCFIDADEKNMCLPAYLSAVGVINVKNFSAMNLDAFDKIILLTKENINAPGDKIIRFDDLEKFFSYRAHLEIPLLHFIQRNPKVKLFIMNVPSILRYPDGAKFNSQLYGVGEFIVRLTQDKSGNVKTTLDRFGYTNAQALEISSPPRLKINPDGTSVIVDDNTKTLQNVKNGRRVTAYQPEHYKNKIYFFGDCIYFGNYAPFDKTLESYLQKMLNEHNFPYCVENYSQFCWGRHQDYYYNLNASKFEPNDIVFVSIQNVIANHADIPFLKSHSNIIPFFDVNGVFDPPHDFREFFCVKDHINELGYKLLAEKYFKFLTDNNFFRDVEFNYPIPPPTYHRFGIPPWVEQGGVNTPVNKDLETYKQTLRPKKLPVGALVMNCNPFTLGHLHLVEYAAAKVVKLYIFVVEEDKSEFPFADRIELVRQGVKKFSNVEVLPSGKFIISQQTFSGYFNKASLQDVAVDSSEDVEIFAKEIAPTLGITIRFAGEEPKDNVTRQYNENMKKILPRYGVEFCEIPRKELDGEPISASTVREALKNGDFNKVKKFVPDTTFDYLLKQHAELKLHFTARVDIKLATTTGDFLLLAISNENAEVWKPTAWQQKGDIGYQIESYAGKLEFVTKSTVNGQVSLSLLGLDVRTPEDYSKRIPYWIDYTKLIVNGQKIFNTVTPAWHDKPYRCNINAKADEEIKIQIEWLPHNK